MAAIKLKVLVGLLLFGAVAVAYSTGAAQQAGGARKGPKVYRLASPLDGTVMFVGAPVDPEGAAAEGQPKVKLAVGGKVTVCSYRPLREGDLVERGQVLVQLDPSQVLNDRLFKKAKVVAAQADHTAAEQIAIAAQERMDRLKNLRRANGKPVDIGQEEYRAAVLTLDRYVQEAISKREAVNLAAVELARADILLELHQIRSPVRGIIRAIRKNAGEGVRAVHTTLIEIEEIKNK
jgi:multidrug efflux pump subunit AcrA (membrane-fusion protein)